MKKQKVRKNIKVIKLYLNILKKASKATMIIGASVTGYCLLITSSSVLACNAENMLDFTEVTTYKQSSKVEAGHYNKYPMKVCISDKFNKYNTMQIIKGCEYVDSVAEGLTFDVYVGDPLDGNADIKIMKGKNMRYLGVTYTGMDLIMIDEEKFHPYGIQSTTIHELGHILGLKHSKDFTSIMYPSCTRMFMSEKDIENLNAIYPASSSVNRDEMNNIITERSNCLFKEEKELGDE